MNQDNPVRPEDFVPEFRRRRFEPDGFLRKLRRFALRLGRPVVEQLYALYFLFQSPAVPKRAKLIIVGALVYFVSPIDSIPDILLPFGFTDDIAVLTLAYTQLKAYLTEDILSRAQAAADALLRR